MSEEEWGTKSPGRGASQAPMVQLKEMMEDIRVALAKQEERDQILVGGRDLLTEAVQVIHAQLEDMTGQLRTIKTPPARVAQPRTWWDSLLVWGGYILAAGLLAWQVWGFFHPRETFEAFAGSLNTAVEQTYAQLPKSAQDLFAAAYRKHGYQVPGTAKGAK